MTSTHTKLWTLAIAVPVAVALLIWVRTAHTSLQQGGSRPAAAASPSTTSVPPRRLEEQRRQSSRTGLAPPAFTTGGARSRFEPSAHRRYEATHEDPIKLYEDEARDPIWAPAMEASVRQNLSESVKALGLPSTKISALDCRSSSCKVQLSFTKADLAMAEKEGAIHPTELLFMHGGHFASQETDVLVDHGPTMPGPDESVAVLPDGTFEKTSVLSFGEEDIDPARYRAWRAGNLQRMQKRAQEMAGR
jgi:hypothetical protein